MIVTRSFLDREDSIISSKQACLKYFALYSADIDTKQIMGARPVINLMQRRQLQSNNVFH